MFHKYFHPYKTHSCFFWEKITILKQAEWFARPWMWEKEMVAIAETTNVQSFLSPLTYLTSWDNTWMDIPLEGMQHEGTTSTAIPI